MVKQKLGLTFWNGLFIGAALTFCLGTVIVDSFFVSKDVFTMNRIYVNGRIYKLCEDR